MPFSSPAVKLIFSCFGDQKLYTLFAWCDAAKARFENGLRWGGKERDKDLICNIFGLKQVVHWSW